eukprot:TRINITY_DN3159_c0_g2_i1.p1 TRINITY_DN3159_c0_g2~~TRINITY_DN3159_c0_g2_i1.p1  ORF type:complete len:288 (+),score=18.37 TRINITY_DN3159_c0_g2_i1:181-1044(+)
MQRIYMCDDDLFPSHRLHQNKRWKCVKDQLSGRLDGDHEKTLERHNRLWTIAAGFVNLFGEIRKNELKRGKNDRKVYYFPLFFRSPLLTSKRSEQIDVLLRRSTGNHRLTFINAPAAMANEETKMATTRDKVFIGGLLILGFGFLSILGNLVDFSYSYWKIYVIFLAPRVLLILIGILGMVAHRKGRASIAATYFFSILFFVLVYIGISAYVYLTLDYKAGCKLAGSENYDEECIKDDKSLVAIILGVSIVFFLGCCSCCAYMAWKYWKQLRRAEEVLDESMSPLLE